MGILKTKFKTSVELIGLAIIGVIAYFAVDKFAPAFSVREAIFGEKIALDTTVINNLEEGQELPLPSFEPSGKVSTQPLFVVGGYPWNGMTGMNAASGGKVTKEGSLMELNNVNYKFERKDSFDDLTAMMVNFAGEFEKGANTPTGDMSAQAVCIMGDGVPYFVSTVQKMLDDKFGGKYHAEVVGGYGMSYGEDGLIAPASWKDNPQALIGKVISVVYGDGNWVVMLNYCAANGLPVNPDNTTYDPNAVNLYHSEGGDFIKSAEELIKSQKGNFTVSLKEIVDGRLTGKSVDKKIDAMASWFPADKMVFDALEGYTKIISTKEFNNQMPTTLVVLKEWAEKNPNVITNFLTSVYTASNQVKMYDRWAMRGAEANAEAFGAENAEYWYKHFKGVEGEKNGIPYSIGGSKVMNLSDAKQYYGLGIDGVSRYKSVYDQVSNYLTTFKPLGFDHNIPTYDQVVNLSYIRNVNIGKSTGKTETVNYSKEAKDVVASGSWRFNFGVGSADILGSSYPELDKLYNLLIQAENTKITIVGYTDNTGNPQINKELSYKRALAVKDWLLAKGINGQRIQTVSGKGSENPIADNSTDAGRAKNRRTDVTLLQ